MSERMNSKPESTPIEATSVASRYEQGMTTAKMIADRGLTIAKKRPVFTAVAALLACTLGYFGWGSVFGSKGVPVAQAGLPAAQASKVVSSGQTKSIEMVVGSYRKTEKLLILNNHKRYQEATMNVVVDLDLCPELKAINPRALIGQTVEAKGEFQEYAGKPQVKVTKAENLKIDPKPKVSTSGI